MNALMKEVHQRQWLNTYGLENAKSWNIKVSKFLDAHWNDLAAFKDEDSSVFNAAENLILEFLGLCAPELDQKVYAESLWLMLCLKEHLNPKDKQAKYLNFPRSLFLEAFNYISEHGALPEFEALDNQPKFSDFVDSLYLAITNHDVNKEMEVKRDAFKAFGTRTDVLEKKCFDLLPLKASGRNSLNCKPSKRTNVALKGKGLDWQLAGFIPANDITLIWGARGSGKTRFGLEAANSLLKGEAFLDRRTKCNASKVLFLASDSGLEPLEEELEAAGLSEEFSKNPNWFLWCHDTESQQEGWGADLKGRIELYEWAKANKSATVIMDSAKAICTKGEIDYTDNKQVTEYMSFLKEVIAPHITVVVLAHDGSRVGRSGGAGSWEEIPSMVISVHRPKNEDGKEDKTKRVLTVHKSRKADERTFFYEIDHSGRLAPCAGTEIIGNVEGLIWKYFLDQSDKGIETGATDEIWKAVKTTKPLTTRRTIQNNLSTMSTGKKPRLQRVRNRNGIYKINPYFLRSNPKGSAYS